MKKLFFLLILLPVTAFAQEPALKIDELVSAYASRHKFNGTVLVAQKGRVVYSKAFGFRDAEAKAAHDVNSVFQIGSLTKMFTAAIIMQLHQEKKLSLQDPLSKYFDGFSYGDRITIEHLLTHTSGIFNYTNDTAIIRSDVTRNYQQKEMIEVFRKYPADFEPGTSWSYSNSGYSLLGYIIEAVTKKSYEQVVRERIFRPLGMDRSGFDFTHLSDPGKSKGYFVLHPDATEPAPVVDSTISYAAGAIFSTAGDLLKWERAVQEGKILTRDSWKQVLTPYKNRYGYGWFIDTLHGRTMTAHSGGIHGFASYLMRFPADDAVIILLDNAGSSSLNAMAISLSAILFGKPYTIPEAPKEMKVDPKQLQEYVGEYQLAPGFSITVTLEGAQLKGQGTGQPAFDLFAEKKDWFFLKVVEAKIEFLRDKDGKITGMVLYQGGMEPRGVKIK